jgi:hypothetical protein
MSDNSAPEVLVLVALSCAVASEPELLVMVQAAGPDSEVAGYTSEPEAVALALLVASTVMVPSLLFGSTETVPNLRSSEQLTEIAGCVVADTVKLADPAMASPGRRAQAAAPVPRRSIFIITYTFRSSCCTDVPDARCKDRATSISGQPGN